VLPDLETLSAVALYAVVGALVFVESGLLVGFFLPGDTVLFAAGLYTADPRSGASVAVLATVVLVAAVSGDAVGYAFGRRTGPALLRREGRVLNTANLARAQAFYDRYGVLAVVAARWIPWVRVFAPVLAGVAGMPYARFLAANVVGAVTWGVGLVVLGHYAASVPGLRGSAIAVGATVAVLSVVGAAVRAYRERSGRRP
jgi:membrane-associated protein